MKYKLIINNEVVYQTDNAEDYYIYLINHKNQQFLQTILYNLLEKSNGYVCNMAN